MLTVHYFQVNHARKVIGRDQVLYGAFLQVGCQKELVTWAHFKKGILVWIVVGPISKVEVNDLWSIPGRLFRNACVSPLMLYRWPHLIQNFIPQALPPLRSHNFPEFHIFERIRLFCTVSRHLFVVPQGAHYQWIRHNTLDGRLTMRMPHEAIIMIILQKVMLIP